MNKKVMQGTLTGKQGEGFLLGQKGEQFLSSEFIWDGYFRHWTGKNLNARYLPQRDYQRGKPIILLWPLDGESTLPYIELYYNERLVKYRGSTFGHMAINVRGEVYNFARRLTENEVMTKEEYFYRPSLGQFAPHPELECMHISVDEKPYYDHFGVVFMRTTHVLRIEGPDLDTDCLSGIFRKELETIRGTAADPKKPHFYRDFNIFTRSCTTIVRDGLRRIGFQKLKGISPIDLFVNTAYFFSHAKRKAAFNVKLSKMEQLKVPEAPSSAPTPILDPLNIIKQRLLPRY